MKHLGVAGLEENLIAMVKSLGIWILVVLVLGAATHLFGVPEKDKGVLPRAAGLLLLGGAGTIGWFLFVLALAVALWGILRLAASKKTSRSDEARWLALALFALCCLFRILLTAGTFHYGFCLALPGVLLFAAFWARLTPAWCAAWIRHRAFFAFAFLAVLLLLSARNFYDVSLKVYQDKTLVIEGPRGSMKVLPMPLCLDLHAALEHLLEKAEPGDTLVVLPEGATFNFLSGQMNPTYYNLFIPPELNAPGVEGELIAQLEAHDVDRILVMGRPVGEYGFRGLGVDYGMALMAFVREHYEEEAAFGPPPFGQRPGGCVVFARKAP
jgi:hypothetical protein